MRIAGNRKERAISLSARTDVLIGGYALFAHGYHRATTDIDVLVPATQAAGERANAALMIMSDHAAKGIDPSWLDEGEDIRVAEAFVLDIMLDACGETRDVFHEELGIPYPEVFMGVTGCICWRRTCTQ